MQKVGSFLGNFQTTGALSSITPQPHSLLPSIFRPLMSNKRQRRPGPQFLLRIHSSWNRTSSYSYWSLRASASRNSGSTTRSEQSHVKRSPGFVSCHWDYVGGNQGYGSIYSKHSSNHSRFLYCLIGYSSLDTNWKIYKQGKRVQGLWVFQYLDSTD